MLAVVVGAGIVVRVAGVVGVSVVAVGAGCSCFFVAAGVVVGAAVVGGVVVAMGVVVVIGAVAVLGSGCLRACCSSSWVLVVVAGKVAVVDAGCHRG